MTTVIKSPVAKRNRTKKITAGSGAQSKQLKSAIQKAKIESLKEVISEFESAMKKFGYGKNTIVKNIENLDDKEPSASINTRYFGSWGQYEGEALPQLDLETATFLTDTVKRVVKAYPKFGIGWLAGDDYDIHINIRNCRSDMETKLQDNFIAPRKVIKKRKPNEPSDAAVANLKVALVKKVSQLLIDDIKTIKGSDDAIFTSTTKPHLKNPAVNIRIKYLGSWAYCKQRKRMHVSDVVAGCIDVCITKLTDQHPKFVIDWDTDDRLFINIVVKNQQSRNLTLLQGALPTVKDKDIEEVEDCVVQAIPDAFTLIDNTADQRLVSHQDKDMVIEDSVIQLVAVAHSPIATATDKITEQIVVDSTTAKEVATQIRKKLEFDHPSLNDQSLAWYGQSPPIIPSTGDEWYQDEVADGSIMIGCRDLGDDYDLEMSELTQDYVNRTINSFRKNYPELSITWSMEEERWMVVHIKLKTFN